MGLLGTIMLPLVRKGKRRMGKIAPISWEDTRTENESIMLGILEKPGIKLGLTLTAVKLSLRRPK